MVLLLSLAIASICVSTVTSQLAQANNQTMPTSMFLTRPQAFAPAVNITQAGAFSQGYIFLAPYQHAGAGPYIYDKFGNLVWDGFGVAGPANAMNFRPCTYLGSPHLCYSNVNQQNGYAVGHAVILDSKYRTVATVRPGRQAMPADMHEFQLIDGKRPTAIMTSYRAVPFNLEKWNITTGQGWLLESTFQEVDVATEEVLFEWYSTNHVDPSDTQIGIDSFAQAGDGFSPSTAFDYFHINSIDKSAKTGNYLVSGRHVSTIYYINATDQNIIWQLSYAGRSDFDCTNFNFSFQHDARIVSESDSLTQISFFDNAANGGPAPPTSPTSSGRFIDIDHTKGTATETRRTLPPSNFISLSQGNTQSLANGHVFHGWGDKSWFSEVDGDDKVVLAGTFTNGNTGITTAMNYRAFSFEWESTPNNTVPVVYSYALNDTAENYIYVSWNGATTVAHWRYYAAEKIGDEFKLIGDTLHDGFETKWRAPKHWPWVMVEAVGPDGTSLANSSFQPTFVPSATLAEYCDDFTCQAVTTYGAMR